MKLYIFELAQYLVMYRNDLYSELQAGMDELTTSTERSGGSQINLRIAKQEECLRRVEALLAAVKMEIMEVIN